ncbi:hypothetical protein Fmac_021109 [Flemingia macrophylla]|uniref:MLO-like protein n=1 Tax=Flemingia macrophylla TaxID=520843 RepID=A0ABD1LVX0_9FABA
MRSCLWKLERRDVFLEMGYCTMEENEQESRPLAFTPTWSIALVLTMFLTFSLFLERAIHHLSNWLRKTNKKPLLAALEKMQEEMLLLGFVSLLLIATSDVIANICIPEKFYDGAFAPCSISEIAEETEKKDLKESKLLMSSTYPHLIRRILDDIDKNSCNETCFLRQFWNSVVRRDYLILRKGFIVNHNLTSKYDFHNYMIQCVEEEFRRIVGVSFPLWGFVVAFMLFNIKGSNLYFWIAIIPISLVLLVGKKLQHVVATLALENAEITDLFSRAKLRPRDELFWFNKPELLLSLIHFILFQWEFGNNSCFNRNHLLVNLRLILGFIGQLLCSYSTLPLYALVTHMGTNYKAALVPERVRETIDVWVKATRRKRKQGKVTDNFELEPLREETSAKKVSTEPVGPVLRPSASVSSSELRFRTETIPRSTSMPREI